MSNQETQLQELLQAHNEGTLSRRDFIQRAALLLGGAAVTGAMVAGGSHAATATAAQSTPASTARATLAATLQGTPASSAKLITKMVEFEAGAKKAPGYLAYPDGKGPFPAIVVIQEWWGLDDHIKAVTELMARNGFAALAPDLYRGEVAKEPAEAQKLAMALIMDQAVADVQGAADYLSAQPFVGTKVGVMGFCMGGRIAMTMAWAGKANIGAVVSFYGGGLNPTDQNFKDVKVPVLGLYGDQDRGIPVASVRGWEAKFKENNKVNEMVIYQNAQHAFFNDMRPAAFNAEASRDAFTRTLAWFGKYLEKTPAK